jgi:hypothetical protein
VDKVQVLEALENAPDYEHGLEILSDVQKHIVNKLREAAGDLSRVTGKKRKHAYMII